MVVTDVCPFTLGIAISKKLGMEIRGGYFMPIINRNTTIPVSRVDRVSTLHANQTEVKVAVFQGENRRTKDNLQLGEFTVKGIPPRSRRAGSRYPLHLRSKWRTRSRSDRRRNETQGVARDYQTRPRPFAG